MEIENLTTGPSVEPLSIAVAKGHLNATHSSDDTYISTLITTARQQFEAETNRALYAQTWTRYLDYWPACIRPVRVPMLDVTSIKYLDTASPRVQQTWAAANYRVDIFNNRINREVGVVWPNQAYTSNAVEVAYRAGYVDTSTSPYTGTVPADIIHCLKMMIGTYWRFRESVIDLRVEILPMAAQSIIERYRLYEI